MKTLLHIFLIFWSFNVWTKGECFDKANFPNIDIVVNTVSNHINDEIFILEYLSGFSGMEQKIIFISLTSENRAKLWLAHLNKKLNTEKFNIAQRETFLEIIYFVNNPVNFEDDSFYSNIEKIMYLYNRVNKYFSREDAVRYFASLSVAAADGVMAERLKACACNRTVDLCYVNGDCRASGCNTSSLGCGLLWLGSCNGLCSHMMEP